MSNNAYIVSAVRTAGGKKNGSLSLWHPADLGAKVLDELVRQSGIEPELIVPRKVHFGAICRPKQFFLPLHQSPPVSVQYIFDKSGKYPFTGMPGHIFGLEPFNGV